MAEETNPQEQNPDQEPDVTLEEDMTEEEVKALHESEDFIANFDTADLEDEEKKAKLEEALKNGKTTVAQKRHYRDKLKKLGEKKEEKKPATEEKKPATEKKEEKVKGIDPNVATEFRLDHPELSKVQGKKVLQHAVAYGITPEEALEDPLMQGYIKTSNAKEDVEEASPKPGNAPGQAIAEKDWSNAKPEEMDAMRNKMLYPNG